MNITLRLAWRNLWRHSRRTWLTVAAMVFSNILLIFLISLQFGTYGMMIDNSLRSFTGHIQIQKPGYNSDPKMRLSFDKGVEIANKLRDQLGIDTLSTRATGFALASSEERSYGIQIIGVEAEYEPRVSTLPGLISEGRFLNGENPEEIVIGKVLARNLRVKVGDELTLLGSGRDGGFAAGVVNIVGVFDSGSVDLDRTVAQVPLDYFQDVFSMDHQVNSIVVSVSELSETEQWKDKLQSFVTSNMPDSDLLVLDWNQLQPGLKQAIQSDVSSAIFMYAVLIVLVAFSVLNTQLMSVLERTREFGTVMALGFRPGRLGLLVLLETVLMAGLGLIIGVACGSLLVSYVAEVGFSYPGMAEMAARFHLEERIYPSVSFLSMLTGPVVIFTGCLLAAIYPALRLRLLQPVEAMRAV